MAYVSFRFTPVRLKTAILSCEGVPKLSGRELLRYRCSEAWNEDNLGMFGGLGRFPGWRRPFEASHALLVDCNRGWQTLTTYACEAKGGHCKSPPLIFGAIWRGLVLHHVAKAKVLWTGHAPVECAN